MLSFDVLKKQDEETKSSKQTKENKKPHKRLETKRVKRGREEKQPKEKASIRARTIGARRHRQAQKDTKSRRRARRWRDEARKAEAQARRRAKQRRRRSQEPMRVSVNIFTVNFIVSLRIEYFIHIAPNMKFITLSDVAGMWRGMNCFLQLKYCQIEC